MEKNQISDLAYAMNDKVNEISDRAERSVWELIDKLAVKPYQTKIEQYRDLEKLAKFINEFGATRVLVADSHAELREIWKEQRVGKKSV